MKRLEVIYKGENDLKSVNGKSYLIFYIEYWHKNHGMMREHFGSKSAAERRVRTLEMEFVTDKVTIIRHLLLSNKRAILVALNHACNLGYGGPTWYPKAEDRISGRLRRSQEAE